jgi:hypothetical protein
MDQSLGLFIMTSITMALIIRPNWEGLALVGMNAGDQPRVLFCFALFVLYIVSRNYATRSVLLMASPTSEEVRISLRCTVSDK